MIQLGGRRVEEESALALITSGYALGGGGGVANLLITGFHLPPLLASNSHTLSFDFSFAYLSGLL
jgi:hypothetical protein